MGVSIGGYHQEFRDESPKEKKDPTKDQAKEEVSPYLSTKEVRQIISSLNDPSQKIEKLFAKFAPKAAETRTRDTHTISRAASDEELNQLAKSIINDLNDTEGLKALLEEMDKEHLSDTASSLLHYLKAALQESRAGVRLQNEPEATPARVQTSTVTDWYLDQFATGTKTSSELLIKAFGENRPALALYFLKNGGSLEALKPHCTTETQPLYNWLEASLQKPTPSPDSLDYYALKLGFGYKGANLLVLQEQANELNKSLKAAKVKVPPFEPVADIEMRAHLEKSFSLKPLWNEFLDTFDPSQRAQFVDPNVDPSKLTLKISPEGQAILRQIREKIAATFKEDIYSSPQIREWLKNNPSEFVIVRSTGKEDSENNANAGGNDSIPFVRPTEAEISESIGRVLASYFGEKSIIQRLAAGDRSLFIEKEPAFLPVVIQTMVMEKNEGKGSTPFDIPRSGVLITKEPGKAEDVTLIQTGLGNNEGVVTSQVGVDTYMIDSQNHIHSAIRKKKTRFVSALEQDTNKHVPKEIRNTQEFLVDRPALTDDILRDMKSMSDHLAYYYGKGERKAMDIEYSVLLPNKKEYVDWSNRSPKEKEGQTPPLATIYLLQTRPLQLPQSTKPSNYLNLAYIQAQGKDKIVKAETLIEGHGDVRLVESSDEILFVTSLSQGLDQYLEAKDRAKVKVIVSAKTAPSTSHQAVTLRPKGVVVMVNENPLSYKAIKALAAKMSPDTPLAIDPQRGVLVLCSNKADASSAVNQGFISYPVPREISTRPGPVAMIYLQLKSIEKKLSETSDPKRIATLEKRAANLKLSLKKEYEQLNSLYNNVQARLQQGGGTISQEATIQELFDVMATQDSTTAKKALSTILTLLTKKTHEEAPLTGGLAFSTKLETWEQIVHFCQDELLSTLEQPGQDPKRLFSLKLLESLIFQEANPDLLFSRSFAQSFKIAQYLKELPQAESSEQAHLLTLAKRHGFSDETAAKWQAFVRKLSKEQAASLLSITNTLNEKGLLTIWLNTQSNALTNRAPEDLIQQLEKSLQSLEPLFEKFDKLSAMRANLSLWSDQEFFNKNIAKLQNTFLSEFGFADNRLADEFRESDDLGKMALLEFVSQAVILYDGAVKAVSGSSQFSDSQTKAQSFRKILDPYFQMMQATFTLLSEKQQEDLMRNSSYSLERYVHELTNGGRDCAGFEKMATSPMDVDPESQFKARAEFRVNAFKVGAHVDISHHVAWPETLEEYFTTFHQNMEEVLRLKKTELGLNESVLPEEIRKEFIEPLKSAFAHTNFSPSLHSITVEPSGEVKVTFAVPLRQHAGTIQLVYDFRHPERPVSFAVEIMGMDIMNRWDMAAACASALAHKGGEANQVRFTKGQPPTIDYKASGRTGIEFSLDVPRGYLDMATFSQSLCKIFTEVCYGSQLTDAELIDYMQNHGFISGTDSLEYEAFRDGFYINRAAMRHFDEKKDYSALAQCAINTLMGLAQYGVSDYKRLDENATFDHPEVAKKYGLPSHDVTSLKAATACYLLHALDQDPTLYTHLEKAAGDVNLRKYFPEIAKILIKAANKAKPIDQQLKLALDAKDFATALVLIETHGQTIDQIQKERLENALSKLVASDPEALLPIYINLLALGQGALASRFFDRIRAEVPEKLLAQMNAIADQEKLVQQHLDAGHLAEAVLLNFTLASQRVAQKIDALIPEKSDQLFEIYKKILQSKDSHLASKFFHLIEKNLDQSTYGQFLGAKDLVAFETLADAGNSVEAIVFLKSFVRIPKELEQSLERHLDALSLKGDRELNLVYLALRRMDNPMYADFFKSRIEGKLNARQLRQFSLVETLVDIENHLQNGRTVEAVFLAYLHPNIASKWQEPLQAHLEKIIAESEENFVTIFTSLQEKSDTFAGKLLESVKSKLTETTFERLQASLKRD